MAPRSVHWHEGMFLRPHHFQAADRHWRWQGNLGEKWDHNYNWGLRAVEIDQDALGANFFQAHSLEARLRDGTLVSVPADGALPRLPLKQALEEAPDVYVLLALPQSHEGRPNILGPGVEAARYSVEGADVPDENTGAGPQHLKMRRLNVALLLSRDRDSPEHFGYDLLPLARVERSGRPDGGAQLSPSYVPPVLACDAWKGLGIDLFQSAYDRVVKRRDFLAEQARSRGISFDSHSAGDARLFASLRLLNEASARLGVLAFARGVHPLAAYLELCGVVGQLAILDDANLVTPALPAYDHDDLGRVFGQARKYLDHLLAGGGEGLALEQRPFIGAGLRMQVGLEKPTWLEQGWQMFIGVKSDLPPAETLELLLEGGLRMKVSSASRVDDLFARGMAGLKFSHVQAFPTLLPRREGLLYLQVDRDSQKEEWDKVRASLTLAIRLNERQVEGSIDRQEVLKVRHAGGTTTLRFTLYLVPPGAR